MKDLLEEGDGAGIAYPSEISARPVEGFDSDVVIDPAGYLDNKKVKVSTSSAFWKRLRHLKSMRKRKSIAKVITETTLEDFETQLTKYTNGGYKIKYVNIDTKAGNSGTGVRYYAVIQKKRSESNGIYKKRDHREM